MSVSRRVGGAPPWRLCCPQMLLQAALGNAAEMPATRDSGRGAPGAGLALAASGFTATSGLRNERQRARPTEGARLFDKRS